MLVEIVSWGFGGAYEGGSSGSGVVTTAAAITSADGEAFLTMGLTGVIGDATSWLELLLIRGRGGIVGLTGTAGFGGSLSTIGGEDVIISKVERASNENRDGDITGASSVLPVASCADDADLEANVRRLLRPGLRVSPSAVEGLKGIDASISEEEEELVVSTGVRVFLRGGSGGMGGLLCSIGCVKETVEESSLLF